MVWCSVVGCVRVGARAHSYVRACVRCVHALVRDEHAERWSWQQETRQKKNKSLKVKPRTKRGKKERTPSRNRSDKLLVPPSARVPSDETGSSVYRGPCHWPDATLPVQKGWRCRRHSFGHKPNRQDGINYASSQQERECHFKQKSIHK